MTTHTLGRTEAGAIDRAQAPLPLPDAPAPHGAGVRLVRVPDSTDGSGATAGLVLRARAGDRRAFEELVAFRLEPAFRIALGITGDEADARDATQDAFIAAWRGLPTLRDPAAFDAWFRQVLVNACRGRRRSRRRSAVHEISAEALAERDELASREPPFDELTASLDALERAFDAIGVADRTILVLHHLEQLPLPAIAASLGIPVGTAKSRLFHARQALQRALENER